MSGSDAPIHGLAQAAVALTQGHGRTGAMAKGYPLQLPDPWLAAAIAFGMSQLYILALNDALLPDVMRSAYYGVVGSNETARLIGWIVLAVHTVEGSVAFGICLKRGYAVGVSLYYATASFLLGVGGLLLLKKPKAA